MQAPGTGFLDGAGALGLRLPVVRCGKIWENTGRYGKPWETYWENMERYGKTMGTYGKNGDIIC